MRPPRDRKHGMKDPEVRKPGHGQPPRSFEIDVLLMQTGLVDVRTKGNSSATSISFVFRFQGDTPV